MHSQTKVREIREGRSSLEFSLFRNRVRIVSNRFKKTFNLYLMFFAMQKFFLLFTRTILSRYEIKVVEKSYLILCFETKGFFTRCKNTSKLQFCQLNSKKRKRKRKRRTPQSVTLLVKRCYHFRRLLLFPCSPLSCVWCQTQVTSEIKKTEDQEDNKQSEKRFHRRSLHYGVNSPTYYYIIPQRPRSSQSSSGPRQ